MNYQEQSHLCLIVGVFLDTFLLFCCNFIHIGHQGFHRYVFLDEGFFLFLLYLSGETTPCQPPVSNSLRKSSPRLQRYCPLPMKCQWFFVTSKTTPSNTIPSPQTYLVLYMWPNGRATRSVAIMFKRLSQANAGRRSEKKSKRKLSSMGPA